MNEPKISVVILNWNRRDDLRECLRNIQRQTWRDYEVIVADNNSRDGSQAMLAEEFPHVRLIQMRANVGVDDDLEIALFLSVSDGDLYELAWQICLMPSGIGAQPADLRHAAADIDDCDHPDHVAPNLGDPETVAGTLEAAAFEIDQIARLIARPVGACQQPL